MTEPTRATPTLSLSGRLVIGLAGLLAVGSVILSLAAFAYGRAAAREAFDRLLVGAANGISGAVSVVEGAPVVDLPVSAFELLALAADDRIAYQVRGPAGVLTGYEDLPVPSARAADTVLYDAAFTDEPARFIRVTRRFAERQFSGTVEVIVGQTLRARTDLAYDITRNALGGLAVGGLAMLGFAVFVVRRALRPLDRLAEQLSARDPLDLTPIGAAVPRDVDVLVQAMNGFIGRLNRQFVTMKSLISDTAHQLRTPVAALRAQADLATAEDDPGQKAQLVGRMHKGTVRLSRLLDQMLARALVIHRGDTVRREPVDLRDVALEIVEAGDHALISPETEIRLEIGDEPVVAMADALSLAEAAKNLLGNALRHGRSPVSVGVDAGGGEVRLWVRDSGPGISDAIRAQLGERFNRGVAAEVGSSGLGLSIAHAVAEAYGGRLEMATLADGFRVALVLPREEAA